MLPTFKKYPICVSLLKGLDAVSIVQPLINAKSGFNIMKEIWKDIPGYRGEYQASNLGRIKSLTRYVKRSIHGRVLIKCRILKYGITCGYHTICSKYNRSSYVHRLIALTFIPNPENKPCINHKNGIKKDNNVKNLEWVTYSENMTHSYNVLGVVPVSRKPIAQYNKNGDLLNSFKSVTAAAKYINSYPSSVSRNCKGKTKTCYGYIFKYIIR